MAQLQISAFNITAAQLSQLATDVTQVTIQIGYDSTAPAGFTITANGPLGSVSLCPKPCPKVVIS